MDLFEYSDVLNSPVEVFYCDDTVVKMPVRSHWHFFVELIHVEMGSFTMVVNNKEYYLKEGDMIFVPPRIIHSLYQDTPEPFRYACLKFNARRVQYLENYLPDLIALFSYIAKMEDAPVVFRGPTLGTDSFSMFFSILIREMEKKEYGYITYIYSCISCLILKILRYWYQCGVPFNLDALRDSDDNTFQDVLFYIDKNSHENINVAELAKMANMSYSHFAKQFNKKFGQSCKQYIELIRLSKAENLLLFTNYDLNYIANETGFSDCSHLIRCFKKRYGITPKQYRKKHGMF